MKYLKVTVSKEKYTDVYISVPDDFDPRDMFTYRQKKIDIPAIVEEQITDDIAWETEPAVSVHGVGEVEKEEFEQYSNSKLEDYMKTK